MALRLNRVIKRAMSTFETLRFDNRSLRELPVEDSMDTRQRAVPNACFALVEPTCVDNPSCVSAAPEVLVDLLGLAPDQITRSDFAEFFSGNKRLPGARPAAHCYCGHQFGSFAGQLGDGATMYLGEVINEKNERWEIQFKGAGKTPFSRAGDGRKVLRSSIREYLASEALFHLGIPTTRAASLVTSDTMAVRDPQYDGNPIEERATIVMRVAPTFLRFGSFEIARDSGPSAGNYELLERLVRFSAHYFPGIVDPEASVELQCRQMFGEVVKRTAQLVAKWQAVGFCHGVLNTDNMSLLGLTIDYGPYGFMERFDGNFVCNTSDHEGRYSYVNQPEVCLWNLQTFATSLAPLLTSEPDRALFDVDADYRRVYTHEYDRLMQAKLGLSEPAPALVSSLLEVMSTTAADYTLVFRLLSHESMPDRDVDPSMIRRLLDACAPLEDLLELRRPRVPRGRIEAALERIRAQPMMAYIMNVSEEALRTMLDRHDQFDALQKRVEEEGEFREPLWRTWLASFATHLHSHPPLVAGPDRLRAMQAVNPAFILRNNVAHEAFVKADQGDFSAVNAVLDALRRPFDDPAPSAPISCPQWRSRVAVS